MLLIRYESRNVLSREDELTPHLRVRVVDTPRLKEFMTNRLFVGNLHCVNKKREKTKAEP